jgi:DNA-binding NarL/FixJ family response regulator
VSVRLRGKHSERISVIAYCRDAAALSALADLVRGSERMQLQGASGGFERLAAIARRGARAVIVARLPDIDEELPGVISHCAGLPLVVLTRDAPRIAAQALRAGARAVLGVGAGEAQIAAAVTSVFHGLLVMPADAAPSREPPAALTAAPEPLTARELEILSLLAGGDSNKTIAARLSISVHTVKFHISSILAKLGVASRTEAVALGLRLGIVLL